MDVETWMARARSAVGQRTVYWLGAGGFAPTNDHPGSDLLLIHLRDMPGSTSLASAFAQGKAPQDGQLDYDHPVRLRGCDCSGFVWWAIGQVRTMNTGQMHADARGAKRVFRSLPEPRIGSLAVYPRPNGGEERTGHVGFVSAIAADGTLSFIHCSGENFLKTQDAIAENSTRAFARAETIFIWPIAAPDR